MVYVCCVLVYILHCPKIFKGANFLDYVLGDVFLHTTATYLNYLYTLSTSMVCVFVLMHFQPPPESHTYTSYKCTGEFYKNQIFISAVFLVCGVLCLNVFFIPCAVAACINAIKVCTMYITSSVTYTLH